MGFILNRKTVFEKMHPQCRDEMHSSLFTCAIAMGIVLMRASVASDSKVLYIFLYTGMDNLWV